ncbi:16S rRNA (guanine(527)-N(7))-methyltransferase RsmG [candidate division WOR-1 bacterium RIFOXYC2_FULL_37_10]|uniref:Ribosomal RNA small subunit methyltransferase G n=1 Tax=candidate division WOR-1 bacterium RIFOXYB2_FULL_37_13 TaxID=1802579 RepID=A0A1F4SWH8_UNCSA|nr:MAG: 16S rRNA (guanine(527)-N(7))-methyltransferase RsmG [candidate division WOR-1 bacterium RIFOXYA2_FULL_37_7]OGC24717.1 MAG: 16S rRNA (guanine(527)-N(7))-methyltransferase RsmG [candidate division WOR-1 bacterium RIFOXYB2_FULL_37_13]OGC34822.1 MAG: 16S rRNA (guanine(527)-N(7))-methyltransferase RsmG [candidate division WOR-1 bacterium RIFOXYC2_FULL_37_10]
MSNVQCPISNEKEKFDRYLEELISWNEKFNLTAVKEPKEIRIRHFEDSLSILEAIDLKAQNVVDVGTGAGFPGIPLKIVRPDIKLTLIDSTRKKVDFLNHVIKILKLENVTAVWGRAEELVKKTGYKEHFDVVLARAVAKLSKLLGYTLPFLRQGGFFIAQKQDVVEQELKEAKLQMEKFNATLKGIKKVSVGGITRSLVVIRKS